MRPASLTPSPPTVVGRNHSTSNTHAGSFGVLKEVQGPRAWPLVGNSFSMIKSGGDLTLYFTKLFQRYGPVAKCHLLGRRMYLIASPELVREVFGSRLKDMEDRFVFPAVRRILPEKGIIFANGHEAAVRQAAAVTYLGHGAQAGRQGSDSRGWVVTWWVVMWWVGGQ